MSGGGGSDDQDDLAAAWGAALGEESGAAPAEEGAPAPDAARVLNQASAFNEVVREQIRAMEIGQRYETITESFNSIRDDAREMVRQIEDGRISTMERLSNIWQKATRGDIAQRFDRIRRTYLDVSRDTKENIERERAILEAYRDFRGSDPDLAHLLRRIGV